MVRYLDGWMGNRIGPVSTLAFHPYVSLCLSPLSLSASLTPVRHHMLLGVGCADTVVSIYAGDRILPLSSM
jgi:hypothetical protein